MTQTRLSVVIPAYNEEGRIPDTLAQVVAYLTPQSYDWEVIVADDGSIDGTARAVREFTNTHPVRLLPLEHRGKGWAVKNGMLTAVGQYRLLCDADLHVPIEQVERLTALLESGTDVAVGSREAPGAARYGEPEHRHLMGRLYNVLVRGATGCDLADTQCGFKGFRAAAADDLFRLQTLDGFSFDAEVLFLASRRGLSIAEIGVDWYWRSDSKVRPLRDSVSMTMELMQIRWRHRQGRSRLQRS